MRHKNNFKLFEKKRRAFLYNLKKKKNVYAFHTEGIKISKLVFRKLQYMQL